MTHLRSFLRCERAASAAEFALVTPLLLLFLLGTIDAGRFMWELNTAEKATQMGVRYAVVSDPVSSVIDTDFVTDHSIPGGDPVPTSVFTRAVCTSTSCTVTGSASGTRNAAAFTNIVTWMQRFDSRVQAANVRVTYENVGLGYAGNPIGPDVAPLTTVEMINLTFTPIILFGATLNLPPVKATMTLEDGDCTSSNDCGSSN